MDVEKGMVVVVWDKHRGSQTGMKRREEYSCGNTEVLGCGEDGSDGYRLWWMCWDVNVAILRMW